jgi:CheY-like chemotaxis protein
LDEAAVLTCPGLKPGHYVRLTVKDTGEGMDEATQIRIFEPFFTTKKRGKGTGLGLAMVFGFIKQSGGHISVASERGNGATFQIYLPRIEMPALAGQPPAVASEVTCGWETILLVEDEDAVRTLTQQILQTRGYTVLPAARGAEALILAQTRDGPIHLLITDVVMPGLDGRLLSEAVTKLRPATKTLFISGYAEDTVLRHGIATTEATFLQKPFDLEALPERVRKLLDENKGAVSPEAETALPQPAFLAK